ncbi:MAG TPA: PhnD/SsuA/transferrin family substrate-binding protein [Gemmataceae bacterium]|jgi:ABC-type phosphate/phosphonate transport system substrate-binding protein|nr:PhnD/SsuA/transferrin family substrate-binding protein [Gemmataceae bacterium]
MTQRNLVGATVAWCTLVLAMPLSAAEFKTNDPVRIGMVSSLFHDIPLPLIEFLGGPFKTLIKEFTGLDGQLKVGGDAFEVGKKLADGKLELAVFHGFEYGWARQKYPELRPLTIAVSKHRQVRAFLVVRDDSAVQSFSDLRGKDVGFPRKSKEHSRLFLENSCAEFGHCSARAFFGQVQASANADDALDDILRGKLQAVVTDTMSLEEYERFKPGCYARLKVVKQSEPFPPAVIVYREGALDADTLKRFRDGMIGANQSPRGRDMMSMFKMTAFEPVPDDYGQMVAEILRHYPAPEPVEKVSQK